MVYPHPKSDCVALCECSREVRQLDCVQVSKQDIGVSLYAGRPYTKQLDGTTGVQEQQQTWGDGEKVQKARTNSDDTGGKSLSEKFQAR